MAGQTSSPAARKEVRGAAGGRPGVTERPVLTSLQAAGASRQPRPFPLNLRDEGYRTWRLKGPGGTLHAQPPRGTQGVQGIRLPAPR